MSWSETATFLKGEFTMKAYEIHEAYIELDEKLTDLWEQIDDCEAKWEEVTRRMNQERDEYLLDEYGREYDEIAEEHKDLLDKYNFLAKTLEVMKDLEGRLDLIENEEAAE
jgi:archaellum component FlaC